MTKESFACQGVPQGDATPRASPEFAMASHVQLHPPALGAIRSYVRSVKRGGSKERVAPGKLLQNL